MSTPAPRYRLFEVVGLELEYPVVAPDDLRILSVVEQVFANLAGEGEGDYERGNAGLSNELAAHVLEVKNVRPRRTMAQVERDLLAGVRVAVKAARDLGGRLLPCGMHPFMRPSEGRTWRLGDGAPIYRTYAKLFPMGHGFMNVQSCHVNLPFGRTTADTMLLHDAAACLMPYLPALAASSPACEGKLRPELDARLVFYARNQSRVPELTGRVIPEHVASMAEYRREILEPAYAALARLPGGRKLRHEWVNSRGAILRTSRRALELRVLDVQECVKMDVAIAAFVRCALAAIVEDLRDGAMVRPADSTLVADLARVVKDGRFARVSAPHLRRGGVREDAPARAVLEGLFGRAGAHARGGDFAYLALAARRLDEGSLAERLRARVARDTASGRVNVRAALRAAYGELPDCLEENEPWDG